MYIIFISNIITYIIFLYKEKLLLRYYFHEIESITYICINIDVLQIITF